MSSGTGELMSYVLLCDRITSGLFTDCTTVVGCTIAPLSAFTQIFSCNATNKQRTAEVGFVPCLWNHRSEFGLNMLMFVRVLSDCTRTGPHAELFHTFLTRLNVSGSALINIGHYALPAEEKMKIK